MGQYFGEKVKFSKLPYYTLLIIAFSFPICAKKSQNIEKNISLFVILVLSNHHSDEMLLKNPSHWTI